LGLRILRCWCWFWCWRALALVEWVDVSFHAGSWRLGG
jgi:hypothetical protein